MKLGSACSQCRNGKRKCNKSAPGSACDQCVKRHLNCSSSNRFPSSPANLLPNGPPTDISGLLPSTAVAEDLIDLYMCYIHDKPHTLFHEPSLRQAAKDGTLSLAVLFGIGGLSARFSSSSLRNKGHVFSAAAKRLIKADLENICLENVQACILVGNICLAESNPDSESLYFVIANRMAQLLKLANENPGDDSVLRETKRRVWWSLYMIDTWASAGLGLSRQFHTDGFAPRLPMDEVSFLRMAPGMYEDDSLAYQPGLWAHMLTLVKIFGHIQDLNKELVDKDWNEEYIESSVLLLSQQLTDFDRDLPPTMVYTTENLAFQAKRGVGRTFVALHLGYHHYATLLYYQYLDQYRPDTPNRRMYVQRCKHHATSFCELIRMAEQQRSEAFHNVLGHMTVVSSSVLLHTLLLGDDEELPMARERLESNFRFLVKLRDLWPSVDLMMNRLITFQNACLRTAQMGTHRFDRWMVKFLLQHALALDEHDAYRLSVESPPTSGPLEDQRLLERSRVTERIIRARQLES